MADSAALLVDEVLLEHPMSQRVLSFLFPLRFLFASRPEIMGRVLGIVYRVIATHLIKSVGQTHTTVRTGEVTLIQRFGAALNLNIHFHMLFLDGVYADNPHGSARFRWIKAPTSEELTQLVYTIANRVEYSTMNDHIQPVFWASIMRPFLFCHTANTRCSIA